MISVLSMWMIGHPELQAWMLYGGLTACVVGLGIISFPFILRLVDKKVMPIDINNQSGIYIGRDVTESQTIITGPVSISHAPHSSLHDAQNQVKHNRLNLDD